MDCYNPTSYLYSPGAANMDVKPTMSFVILSYNQEKFIRRAIEAAFAQSYEPLEIILSDDCSTDSTYDIMCAMSRGYSGPKSLKVRKTEKNCGTLRHVVDVASITSGELLILAGGDDISKPNRVELLVEAWQNTGAWGIYSRFDRIDNKDYVIGRDELVEYIESINYPLRKYFDHTNDKISIVHGATSAYDKRLFSYLKTTPQDYILSEDGALSVLIHLLNKEVFFLNKSLVFYRESDQSLTNSSRNGPVSIKKYLDDEESISRFARSQANRCKLFLRFHTQYGASSNLKLDVKRLQKEYIKHYEISNWHKKNIISKLSFIFTYPTFLNFKWCIPRLLPKFYFLTLKTMFFKFKDYFTLQDY
jgi:cellulose synthase/poly-beta-1,6-N-acetylglucosamine synthase-like glycosyltransferase